MAVPIPLITEALALLNKAVEWLQWYFKTADIRRMKACIEAAEKYIQCAQKEGTFKQMTDKQREQFLRHYEKRFWHYNN